MRLERRGGKENCAVTKVGNIHSTASQLLPMRNLFIYWIGSPTIRTYEITYGISICLRCPLIDEKEVKLKPRLFFTELLLCIPKQQAHLAFPTVQNHIKEQTTFFDQVSVSIDEFF